MSNILDEYTAEDSLSPQVKERLLESARLFLLTRDLGELFTLGLSESGRDLFIPQDASSSE